MEDLELLLNIGNIILDAETYDKALQNIVSRLNRFLESDVCSIYLYNHKSDMLMMIANHGLHEDSIGKVSMKADEGLTGLSFSEEIFQFIQQASQHEQFKYFPGIGEEPFDTFIGIPLRDKKSILGVLVFQFQDNKELSPVLKKLLITVASLVSGVVSKYNISDLYEEPEQFRGGTDLEFPGFPLSEGIAIGTPVHLISQYIECKNEKFNLEQEKERFDNAFESTRKELNDLVEQMESSKEHFGSDIFSGHLLMLQDPSFRKEILHRITKYEKGAAFSIRFVSNKFIHSFKSIKDDYLRERASDVEDICQRLLSNLGALQKTAELKENSIIIASQLTPGETASLDMERVIGFVTQKDGPTSHTAILARNRQIPAVSGVEYLLKLTEFADKIIVDGHEGKIIINPSQAVLEAYESKRENQIRIRDSVKTVITDDAVIRQNRIKLFSNVSSLGDAAKANNSKADGIGLVRTEIFYLQRKGDFNFDAQVKLYSQILESFPNGPVIFRLLDLGADKRNRADIAEDNPALGLRGIRVLLENRDLFREQARALLQASTLGNTKLLVPFITETREFTQAKDLIQQTADEMGIQPPPVGAMIEIPSAAFILEELNEKADFFSVGTNDLFQYFCAVDRNNSHVNHLYSPDMQPFVSLLDLIYQKTKNSGKDVEICGEIAADPSLLSILIHIGYKQFSVNPYALGTIKSNLIQKYSKEEVKS
jgi:phosphotransferase system, enzyme I, PtsP